MLYNFNMTKPVQVSIDQELLDRIARDPEAKRIGRSAFIRAALRVYLEARRRRALDEQIFQAYAEDEGAMVDEVGALIGNQAWPKP
jgi:metal-responsive CopG/Arc/MetJ family transcriptional regulator